VEPLLVFPDPAPVTLTHDLEKLGYPWLSASRPDQAASLEPADGWSGAVVWADPDPTGAFAMCRALRKLDPPLAPLILLIGADHLSEVSLREDLFDDFCLAPWATTELSARLELAFWHSGQGSRPDLIEHGPLTLNLETYQAAVAGRPLDLTYMEYELLRFLASHPGRVFTRETLLSRVWGYEYFGGARTVDVHIRRLRAKLGEENANLIHTVRSVGYRFGQPRWPN
jgi:DNA-binding response OmpR family regulator